jgi:hypothetical protein
MRARIRARRPSPAFVIACIALFVAMSGVAYAANTVRSRDIVNDAVTSADIKGGGGKTGDIKNRDVNALLAVAKGFATIDGQNANGNAPVLNFGGQQTATSPPGVTAVRQFTGTYLVTFKANTGTGKFLKINSVDDVAIQATGENFSNASAEAISANENEVVIRVRLRTFNGNNPANEDFTVQFYARTTS